MIELKSEGLNPEQSAIRDQKLIIMRDVVNRLKPRYKLLIEMRYFQELSYDEIATEMDLPLGTVKAQLFRAREFLFNILHSTRESI
jgi:RNA polymerase sigma factor (sigma-70 family)